MTPTAMPAFAPVVRPDDDPVWSLLFLLVPCSADEDSLADDDDDDEDVIGLLSPLAEELEGADVVVVMRVEDEGAALEGFELASATLTLK